MKHPEDLIGKLFVFRYGTIIQMVYDVQETYIIAEQLNGATKGLQTKTEYYEFISRYKPLDILPE